MQSKPWQIEWSDTLSMSNPKIDAEHQHLIALVNELNNAILVQLDKAEVQYLLYLILEDAIAHFAHEERFLAGKGYPTMQEHALHHAEIIARFHLALNRIEQTKFTQEWIDIGLAIRDQLTAHVLNEIAQYGEYFRTA